MRLGRRLLGSGHRQLVGCATSLSRFHGPTSTGHAAGRLSRVTLDAPDEVAALADGGALWLEPSGAKDPLPVGDCP